MTTREFIIKLKQFNDTLPEVRDKLLIDAVFSGAALAKNRIINSRESAEGTPFGIYSPKYLAKRIKAGKGPDPRVNFSYTAKMWQSTQPTIVTSQQDEVHIKVAPLDLQRQDVMGYHDRNIRFGGKILRLSQKEIDIITEDFTLGLQDHLNKSFT